MAAGHHLGEVAGAGCAAAILRRCFSAVGGAAPSWGSRVAPPEVRGGPAEQGGGQSASGPRSGGSRGAGFPALELHLGAPRRRARGAAAGLVPVSGGRREAGVPAGPTAGPSGRVCPDPRGPRFEAGQRPGCRSSGTRVRHLPFSSCQKRPVITVTFQKMRAASERWRDLTVAARLQV